MKPSDHEIARMCHNCALVWELKSRALKKSSEYHEILIAMQEDALKIARAWAGHLESIKKLPARCVSCDSCHEGKCSAKLPHVEPPAGCALDELNMWLMTGATEMRPEESSEWLMLWANRRCANIIECLLEPMRRIANKSSDKHSQAVALKALRELGIYD